MVALLLLLLAVFLTASSTAASSQDTPAAHPTSRARSSPAAMVSPALPKPASRRSAHWGDWVEAARSGRSADPLRRGHRTHHAGERPQRTRQPCSFGACRWEGGCCLARSSCTYEEGPNG